jgi:hypothetical protein
MLHHPKTIRAVYASYLNEFGAGYDRTTFFMYVAAVLFDDDEGQAALSALRNAAKNLEGRTGLKDPNG